MERKSDSQIQKDVLEELKWDTRVEETEVGVEVDQGIVTLTGTVSSYIKKLAAQEAAHRVLGVLDVANDIQVKVPGGQTLTDTEVAQAVRRALEWDVLVPDKRIRSTVTNGRVTLEGTVDLLREREDAEDTVGRLTGVHGVINRITVTAPKVQAEDIRKKVEDALKRRAEREAERIEVAVKEGTVTVSGRVHSWAELQALIGAVSHAPGVRNIENRLHVDPYF